MAGASVTDEPPYFCTTKLTRASLPQVRFCPARQILPHPRRNRLAGGGGVVVGCRVSRRLRRPHKFKTLASTMPSAPPPRPAKFTRLAEDDAVYRAFPAPAR
jgi:hypothetical protein